MRVLICCKRYIAHQVDNELTMNLMSVDIGLTKNYLLVYNGFTI